MSEQDWKQRAEKAEMLCVIKDAAIRGLIQCLMDSTWNGDGGKHIKACEFGRNALSPECGKGWLSPEKAELLRHELLRLRYVVDVDDVDSINRVLEETK